MTARRPQRPLEIGLFPACGFRIFFRAPGTWTDDRLLTGMGLVPHWRLSDSPQLVSNVVSITAHGPWVHVIDESYALWNDRVLRRAALRPLIASGEVFTFQLPDPDMSYAFALYRGGRRVRLRVVDSPRWNDQVMRIDRGARLAGETDDWRGEPFPRMEAIARGLGIAVESVDSVRHHGWGARHGDPMERG